MDRVFHIREGLGVFWRDRNTLQIGLDPRTGVTVGGLNRTEQDFVASLSRPLSATEVEASAHRMRIASARRTEILDMLDRAAVLAQPPRSLSGACVQLTNLDALGVSIALALAEAGVGAIVFGPNMGAVGRDDHPALAKRLGLPRAQAFLTALRSASVGIRTSGTPDVAVVTGSRLIDPSATGDLCGRGVPHLLAWVEEVDACIGPLVEPGENACAGCVHEARCEADPAWVNLAPQAVFAKPIVAPANVRNLACDLAVRCILGFLAGDGNSLREVQWRVPRGTAAPRQVSVVAHPACPCSAHSLLLGKIDKTDGESDSAADGAGASAERSVKANSRSGFEAVAAANGEAGRAPNASGASTAGTRPGDDPEDLLPPLGEF